LDGNKLCCGTNDGRVCEFYTDKESPESYNDDGSPIYCCYETPDFSGHEFYKNKTFRYLAVRLGKNLRTSAALYLRRKGVWTLVKQVASAMGWMSFDNVAFSAWNFSADQSSVTLNTKTRLKRVDKTAYKFENSGLNEPFGLLEYAVEYEQKSYYKG
jgi:hypothetical protein